MWISKSHKAEILKLYTLRVHFIKVVLTLSRETRLVRAELLLPPLHISASQSALAEIGRINQATSELYGGGAGLAIISNYYLLKSHNNWDLLNWNAFRASTASNWNVQWKLISIAWRRTKAKHLECTKIDTMLPLKVLDLSLRSSTEKINQSLQQVINSTIGAAVHHVELFP